MKIAFFDFDGTITTDDSLIKFIRFAVGDFKMMLGMFLLSPMLVAFKLKIIPNYIAKQKMLAYFFKGMKESTFKQLAHEYSLNHIDSMLREKAMAKIAWHKEQGHRVVIVSASIESWLAPWCAKHDIELLGTQLEFKSGFVTGELATKNCFGPEKVSRIKTAYTLSEFEHIYAYGDSSGDTELLELADTSGYRIF
ncbi:HAD family hydrolase [Lelliottia steviae]|uniref:HAD family hydrolase n=1 Tax=Pseudoalteromonas sp. PB2-1 TaxID=2907242 RepID=UPI00187E2A23|nr:HAD family hydrolase [Lelliottia steviae]|tara:strand:- start:576 stop:1160 length:585 start_codon:yes stop_codon:yes gene_type:complete